MTKDFDFEKIVSNPAICEVTRLVETFNIDYHRAPKDMVIKIIQVANNCYYGDCNYGIWGPEQVDSYKSGHPKYTVVDALNDVLNEILAFDNVAIPNELLFWVGDNEKVTDGNGEEITRDEAIKRREANREHLTHTPWTQTLINGGPWWLISKNFDKREFSIIGPIEDDTEYIKKVVSIQKSGIDFSCETVPINKQNKEELIKYCEDVFRMKLVENDILYNI
jgi:hypothetical protein